MRPSKKESIIPVTIALVLGGIAALLIAGCNSDLPVASTLERTRVLGARVEIAADPGRAEVSPGEFAHLVRVSVERDHARVVVIDSLNGYLNAMPGERYLVIQLHELLAYLGQRNVATILVSAHQGLLGPMTSPVDTSYLADAVVLLRFFENRGEIRQALSVVKKRGGNHERTIREFRMQDGRIRVGEPLREYRGVLTGVPERRV